MTVWEPVADAESHVVAVYNLPGADCGEGARPRLTLRVGELLRVRARAGAWYWGRHARHRTPFGLFPASYVVPSPRGAELHTSDEEDDSSDDSADEGNDPQGEWEEEKEEPEGEEEAVTAAAVLKDIDSTLREWLPLWKQLYVERSPHFKFIELCMRALLQLRSGAADDALPAARLKRAQKQAALHTGRGARVLRRALVLRRADGAPRRLAGAALSACALDAAHQEAQDLIDKNIEGPASGASSAPPSEGGVLVKVLSLACRCAATRCELQLALCDMSGARRSEPLVTTWPPTPGASSPPVLFPPTGSGGGAGAGAGGERALLVAHVARAPPAPAPRRPAGIALLEVTKYLGDDSDEDLHIPLPFYPCEKESMDSVVKRAVSMLAREPPPPAGLWVSWRVLRATRVRGALLARPLQPPEVPPPHLARNDLYVTLVSGAFSRARASVELRASLVGPSGAVLQNAISAGAGAAEGAEYRSLVYRHEDRPRWAETFRVSLGVDEFRAAALLLRAQPRSNSDAKDRAEKPLALALVRLVQPDGTVLADGPHQLTLYKPDWRRLADEREAAAALLALPASHAGLSPAPKESLLIETRLASTKLTQREEILGVLKWRVTLAAGGAAGLRRALAALRQAARAELVKFLPDVLDALAQVLTEGPWSAEAPGDGAPDGESGPELALDCLLRAAGLLADHKFAHYRPVLLQYIDTTFCDAKLYERLFPVLTHVVLNARAGCAQQRLMPALKCLEALLRLLARSRQLHLALSPALSGPSAFDLLLEELIDAMAALMSRGAELLPCQGAALKYLPQALPHALPAAQDLPRLAAAVVRWLDALPRGALGKQRLQALLALLQGPLPQHAAARRALLPHAAAAAARLLQHGSERTPMRASKAARLLGAGCPTALERPAHARHKTALCAEVLGACAALCAQVERERARAGDVSTDDAVNGDLEDDERVQLVRLALPALLRATATLHAAVSARQPDVEPRHPRDRDHDQDTAEYALRRCVCALLDMVRGISHAQFSLCASALRASAGAHAEELPGQALALLRALLARPAQPPHWAALALLVHQAAAHALWLLGSTLRRRLERASDAAETRAARALCAEWWSACCALAGGAPRSRQQPPALRRAARATVRRVRAQAQRDLADMWEALERTGPLEEETASQLAGALVAGSARAGALLPLLGRVLRAAGAARALLPAAHALQPAPPPRWRRRLLAIEATPAVAQALQAAADQLVLLDEYRQASPTQPLLRALLLARLLHFYQEVDCTLLYVRYTHELVALQRAAGRAGEAGLALRRHADLLTWSDTAVPPELLPPDSSGGAPSSQRELLQQLLAEVARLLQEGRMWQLAAEVLQEQLARHCSTAAGYAGLGALHARLAQLYERLARAPRLDPHYFRVLHHGRGFPAFLRAPHGWVHRGEDCEQLPEFVARLLDEWPRARLLPRLDPPGPEVTDSDHQYLQVNLVEPVVEERLKRLSGQRVDPQVLHDLLHAQLDCFAFSRPFLKGDAQDPDLPEGENNEFARRWLERTELRTESRLPNALRCAAVRSAEVQWLPPVQCAVDAMRAANRELKRLTQDAARDAHALRALSMRLAGTLDPAVQGGVGHYERAFLQPHYLQRQPHHAPLVHELRRLVAQQPRLLQQGLRVHASLAGGALRDLQKHLEERLRELQAHARATYGADADGSDPEQTGDGPLEAVNPQVVAREEPPREDVALRRSAPAPTPTPSTSDVESKHKFFSFSSSQLSALARYSGASLQRRRAPSQWYAPATVTASAPAVAPATVSTPATPDVSLRELRQELVPARPPRADAERRLSALSRASLPPSPRDSLLAAPDDTQTPPPLPAKSRDDRDSRDVSAARLSYDTVWTPRGSFLHGPPGGA